MPQTEVVKHSFGAFSFTVLLAIIVIFFCFMFFYVRRKRSSKHVDEKAGDEGED
jgi:preprotein translocase subunit YajC